MPMMGVVEGMNLVITHTSGVKFEDEKEARFELWTVTKFGARTQKHHTVTLELYEDGRAKLTVDGQILPAENVSPSKVKRVLTNYFESHVGITIRQLSGLLRSVDEA